MKNPSKNNENIVCVRIFIICTIWAFSSCVKKEPEPVNYDMLKSPVEDIAICDISNNISYVKLSAEIPISSIHNIRITDNHYFASCHPGMILKFNKEGNEPTKIGSKGRGPNEYLRSSNFAVDDENKRVFVLRQMGELIVYDYTGNFLKNIRIAGPSTSGFISYFGNNKLLISDTNSNYYWRIIDLNGTVVQKKVNHLRFKKPVLFSINPGQIVENYHDKIFYYNLFNDTIFQINDNGYKAFLTFEKNENRLTPERFVNESPSWFDKNDLSHNNIPKFCRLQNFFVTNNFLLFCYSFNYEYEITLLNRISKKQSYVKDSGKLLGIRNDYDCGLPFLPKSYFVEKNSEYLVSWIDAYQLKAHVTSKAFRNSTAKYPEKKKALEKLANSLNENDNPVLMLVKLKE